jgi:general secretion pathway protein M
MSSDVRGQAVSSAATAAEGRGSQWLRRAEAAWRRLSERERRLVAAAAILLTFGALVMAVQPAARKLRELPAQRAALQQQMQLMQQQAQEARALRSLPAVNASQAVAALEAATARLGAAAKLNVQGDRATVALSGVGPTALREWLLEVRSGARARPTEVRLTRGAAGWEGVVMLALPGPGGPP